ncbi:RNA polymerase sigma factor [Heyndrickxia vini]|uniref:RNA polymerase sigma factor n=1 Tax=Heyndrickxia vini TaxID=1476025 RepID=A0ABX7E7R3_9BACI|nr:RNA polymerase sigma factor [Heyndrickxia vini]QQZ11344.1 RNA polymerase sigma factor [Heyndrickxia vini]
MSNEVNEQSREIRQKFDALVANYGDDFWNYCRYLTGSPWDGEDLYQDTMLKVLGGMYQRWHPTNLKSYLFRMATNAWIDQCRREKRKIELLAEVHQEQENPIDQSVIEDALEQLSHLFSPKQTALFLLMEVFHFQANEVASIIKTSQGAVYATLNRMRNKLKSKPAQTKTAIKNDDRNNKVIQTYLKAFNEGNLEGILQLLSENVHYEASLGFIEISKDEVKNGSLQYGLPGHTAKEFTLWGKSVIIVLADSESGPLVHDIQYQQVEHDKIVYHRSYFFRKELIIAACKELNLNPQLNKSPFLNWEAITQ